LKSTETSGCYVKRITKTRFQQFRLVEEH